MSVEWVTARVIKRDLDRKTVIEAYAKYDCPKKGLPTPGFEIWDWSGADAIDREMAAADLKEGVPAGYRRWDKVEITMSDLRECAVEGGIFAEQLHRKLGLIEGAGGLLHWEAKLLSHVRAKPDWYDKIKNGETLDETAPLILRPAVNAEAPARWYVEDGSGRAVTFVANQSLFDPSQVLAVGYLGRELDPAQYVHA